MARWLTGAHSGTGLLAITSDDGQVVGHGQFVPDGTGSAEVAFAIADRWQGRGIATLLLAQLAEAAAAEGLRQFTAVVMPGNRKMIATFRDSGFPVEVHSGAGELQVTFPTTLTEDGLQRFERRERAAAVAATVEGLPASASLRDVPEAPESPSSPSRPIASSTSLAAARAGVRALVVLSAGFSEVGEAGERRQQELIAVCRAGGMRLVGPNCLGVNQHRSGCLAERELRARSAAVRGEMGPGHAASSCRVRPDRGPAPGGAAARHDSPASHLLISAAGSARAMRSSTSRRGLGSRRRGP